MNSYNMRMLPKGYREKYGNFISITYDCINSIPCVQIYREREANIKLQDYHKQLLTLAMKRNDGLKYGEVAMLINMYTDESLIVFGEFNKVSISKNLNWIDMSKRHKERTLISIHNHPYGGTFSAGDIFSFVENSALDIITAVSNDGRHLYILKKVDANVLNVKRYIDSETNKMAKQCNKDIDIRAIKDKVALKFLNKAKNNPFMGLIYIESVKREGK